MKTPKPKAVAAMKSPKRFAVGTPVRVVMPGIDGVVSEVDEERTVLSEYWHTVQTKSGDRREPGSILELIPPPIGVPTPRIGKLAENIRHARPESAAPSVFPLTVTMIFFAGAALLVTAVGTAPLRSTRLHTARQVAITLTSITMGTDPECRVTLATNPVPESNLAWNCHSRLPYEAE